MTLWDYLETMRNKPEHVRQRIALLTTLAVFVLVVNVWWNVHDRSLSAESISFAEATSPIGVVGDMFAGVASQTRGFMTELHTEIAKSASTTVAVNENIPPSSSEDGAMTRVDDDTIGTTTIDDRSFETSTPLNEQSTNPSL